MASTASNSNDDGFDSSVLIETDLGVFVVDLRGRRAPNAVHDFIRLCECGFYTNNLFFKIEKDFIAVCGDPTGTGRGGSTFDGLLNKLAGNENANEVQQLPLEVAEDEKSTWKGHVLCSLSSPGNNAVPFSQLFLTLSQADTPRYSHLVGKHTVIGRIVEDESDVIGALSRAFIDDRGRPLRDIRFRRTVVLQYPPGMQALDVDVLNSLKPFLPDPEQDVPKDEWDKIEERPSIFSNEAIDDEEASSAKREKLLAETRAVELEILGDITSADAKPEENVLFVCKLNPTTKSEDLELIFSRFGDVTECEVKRDPVTKESLQYAFVGFATKEQCEEAYRKMQDVMIDGRRIKVDFSQSEGKRASLIASNTAPSSRSNIRPPPTSTGEKHGYAEIRKPRRRSNDELSSSSSREERRSKKKESRRRGRSRSPSSSSGSDDSRRHRRKHKHERKDKKKKRRHRSRDRR